MGGGAEQVRIQWLVSGGFDLGMRISKVILQNNYYFFKYIIFLVFVILVEILTILPSFIAHRIFLVNDTPFNSTVQSYLVHYGKFNLLNRIHRNEFQRQDGIGYSCGGGLVIGCRINDRISN